MTLASSTLGLAEPRERPSPDREIRVAKQDEFLSMYESNLNVMDQGCGHSPKAVNSWARVNAPKDEEPCRINPKPDPVGTKSRFSIETTSKYKCTLCTHIKYNTM